METIESAEPQPVADTAATPGAEIPAEADGAQEHAGAGQSNVFESLHAETVNFTHIQNELDPLYENRTALRHFTCRDGKDVSEDWEETCETTFRGSDDEVDALLRHLDERRVLLLEGPPGAGRVSAAIYLGRRLRARTADARATLLVQSLARHVRLDVRQVASRDKDMRGRMVIFRDLLGRVERAERSAWMQMAEQLRERGAYVVFITDPGGGASTDALSPTHGLTRTLARHTRELREAELDASIEKLERRGALAPELLPALRAGREWMLETFPFVAQIADFLSLYADLNEPGLPPEEGWRRFHDAGARLLRDRDGDLDAWSAVMALALVQSVRDARGARWVDFDGLHRRVSDWLRADVERRATGEDDEGEEPAAGAPPRFEDAPLLEAARAETYDDATTLACSVRFRDGVAPEPVWQALLTRHRRALLTIFPGLRALAERGGDLSVPAAQVIGRLGEMDPERITLPLAGRWLRAADARQQRAVGPLFEGVLASAKEPYRALCLRRLRAMRSGAQVTGDAPGVRLPAVIAAYSWIGDHDLDHAMGELGAIAAERLAPMIADAQQIERLSGQVQSQLQDAATTRDRAALRDFHGRLQRAAAAVYRGQVTTLVSLQMSLNSLCATRGVMPVISRMHRWVGPGGWKMGVLVAILFLNENGVADTLQKSRGDGASDGGGCNPLVERLAEGEEEVRQLAVFLNDLFESLATPFLVGTELARDSADSLCEHLSDWIRDALAVPAHEAAVRRLIETMLLLPYLREPLLDLLQCPGFAENDPQLRAFAARIRV
jgi:hypothetical protein